jgi:undecaprenyl phosphate N,N'-diacetylbacillosamine 1-phosphate transferase
MKKRNFYTLHLKRILDFMLAFQAIIVLLPVMIFVAILIRMKLGKPVIFKVSRPGKDEKIFTMYKFRSMSNDRDQDGKLLPDNIRLTKFGKLLRSLSLDELPELFNILKGDMSIVGPRPLATHYLPYYSEIEKGRHGVKPGLTGLAQVSGRNGINWEKKFEYDLKYIDHMCFFLDIKIILKTCINLFFKENIGIRGVDSLEDFDSYREKQNLNKYNTETL